MAAVRCSRGRGKHRAAGSQAEGGRQRPTRGPRSLLRRAAGMARYRETEREQKAALGPVRRATLSAQPGSARCHAAGQHEVLL